MGKSCTIRGGGVGKLGVLLLALAGFAGSAAAQQPTSEQISAIRKACRSDYERYCASVPTGGSAALACLQQNSASLSGACQKAVAAVGGGATNAAPPPASTPPAGAVTSAAASWPHQLNYNGATVVVYQPQPI